MPLWTYDGGVIKEKIKSYVCRGVSYWKSPGHVSGTGGCSSRIIAGTLGAKLVALDTMTGTPCPDFGTKGEVNLREGLGDVQAADYYTTSPPAIYGDLAIVGGLVDDNGKLEAPAGVIRAYNVRTGKLAWSWDTVPPSYVDNSEWKKINPASYGKFTRGSPNSWSLMSVDTRRGIVYVPMGSTGSDNFKGNLKPGLDTYGSSVVALDAMTGKLKWSFKLVEHDVWDYDTAAQPVLYTHRSPTGEIPATVAASKVGHIYLLNRDTGEPILETRRVPVPTDSDSGEVLASTQLEPTLPPPLLPKTFSIDDVPQLARRACRDRFKQFRFDCMFTPPSKKGSTQYPSPTSGISWGGVSIDEKKQILITNVSMGALEFTLIPRAVYDADSSKFLSFLGSEPMYGTPYGVKRHPFSLRQQFRMPCNPPPWGKLIAIHLPTGKILWEKPLGRGNYGGESIDGLLNIGGSIITAGNLIFIGASIDAEFRAFDLANGNEVWSHTLKNGAQATPMTYRYKGKQYVVIADGGHATVKRTRFTVGDRLVAFALE